MSEAAEQKVNECGGVFGALCDVLPALETVALVERSSTSIRLRHAETGETFGHSGGKHFAIAVVDAADIPRSCPISTTAAGFSVSAGARSRPQAHS